MRCFVHFDLTMCSSPQRHAIVIHQTFKKVFRTCGVLCILTLQMRYSPKRRAIFGHLNLKKRSGHAVFCTFWLDHVLLATAACPFWASELEKEVRPWGGLTWPCAPRHSGVPFLGIWTWKRSPAMRWFDLNMCFSPQRRAIFEHLNFKNWSGHAVFSTCWHTNALHATAARRFISVLNSYLRTHHFSEANFSNSRDHKSLNWKTQRFILRLCIFFLLPFSHLWLLSSD